MTTNTEERTGPARRIHALTDENEALRAEIERLRSAPPKERIVYRIVNSAAEAFQAQIDDFHAKYNGPDRDDGMVSIPIINPKHWGGR